MALMCTPAQAPPSTFARLSAEVVAVLHALLRALARDDLDSRSDGGYSFEGIMDTAPAECGVVLRRTV